jgi:hypothetical protein
MSKKKPPVQNGGFWDDADDFVPPSEWFKFDEVGDKVTGTLARLARKKWDDGSVGIELHWKETSVKPVSANQRLLKQALVMLKPEVGCGIAIEYIANEKLSGGRTMKHFLVTVARSDGQVDTVDTRELTGKQPGF